MNNTPQRTSRSMAPGGAPPRAADVSARADPAVPNRVCLFRQPWWVAALAGDDEHGEVRVEIGKGKTASLPYVVKRRFGFRILQMPPLTQVAGPSTVGIDPNDARRLADEKDLFGALIDQLPPHDAFNQCFHWSVSNWLPWYWRGFAQSTRYTYRLEDLSDEDRLWTGFQPNIKSDIKKALGRFGVRIHSDHDVDRFLDISELTFKRQGKKLPYPRSLVRRLEGACAQHGCRRLFFAEDAEHRIHAAVFLVWDEHSAYYLMGGGDPKLRNSGATSAAVWEAIKFAATVSRSFDFEGSMLESVERFFRGFGAAQTPYSHVWKFDNRVLRAMYHTKCGLGR